MTKFLDSRDLEEELNELLEAKENNEEYDEERLKALEDLKDECEGYGWDYGITFIPEDEFKDYCKELAEECYITRDENNPLLNYIDWDNWAEDCEMDYNSVTFEDEEYYYREA